MAHTTSSLGRPFAMVKTGWRVLRTQGPRMLMAATAAKLAGTEQPVHQLLVHSADALAVDLTTPHPAIASPLVVRDRPLRLAWISSPPGKESGGHQNMFRFINFASEAGHSSTVHLYDAHGKHVDLKAVRAMLNASSAYPERNPELRAWDRAEGVGPDFDAIIATGWETAYPSYRDKSSARRLYFIQDFEPLFYPTGSQSLLAESTYRFGFHGLTAGGWLAGKLAREYGMKTDYFDFAADTALYNVTNTGPRHEVFFYSRPVTARRAFDLGVLALTRFAQLRPEATINLAGWDVGHMRLPFRFVNHSSLELSQLSSLYNRCATGLVLSLTNLSLLPLELLAAGVTPVVNDGPNNREVANHPRFVWSGTTPREIADALARAYDEAEDGSQAQQNAASVPQGGWKASGEQFTSALSRIMAS